MNKKQAFKVGSLFLALIFSCSVIIFGSNHLAAQTLLTTIPLGSASGNGVGPIGIDVNPTTNRIYVISGAAVSQGIVTVIDGGTNEVIDTIKARGFKIAINPITNRIYLAEDIAIPCWVVDLIRVIDSNRNTLVDRIVAGFGFLNALGINPATNLIYVSVEAIFFGCFDIGIDSISVIDGQKGHVVDVINFDLDKPGFTPQSIGINPTINHIYVAGNVRSGVSGVLSVPLLVIDGRTNKVIGDVSVSIGEVDRNNGIAVNPETNRIYVISQISGNVAVIQD